MSDSPKDLEAQLQQVWRLAPNTRKKTSQRRIDSILRSSRSMIAIGDLLRFLLFLMQAFAHLSKAVIQGLFAQTTRQPDHLTKNTRTKQ